MATSDNGSRQIPNESETTKNCKSNAPRLSYSSVAQSTPTKEQAIIIESHEGITITEYVMAVGELINPSNIRFISRISNGRICIFLSSKQLVEEMVNKYPKILIKNVSLEIRPLLTKNKRVIISNVCPVIPNYVIEEKLLQIGITPMSSITHIRAGISAPGFSHILSFRRQMYVQAEDFDKLPESLQIQYEGTNYWLYFSSDIPNCFICKSEGHLAKQCPTTNSETQNNVTSFSTDVSHNKDNFPQLPQLAAVPKSQINADNLKTDHSQTPDPSKYGTPKICNNITNLTPNEICKSSSASENQISQQMKNEIPNPSPGGHPHGSKRPLSTTTSSNSNSESHNASFDHQPENSGNITVETITQDSNENLSSIRLTKKSKKDTKDKSIYDILMPVKDIIESEPNSFSLSYLQLVSFFENTIGESDIISVALNYTKDLRGLTETLKKLHPFHTDKGIKNRSTRIEKKLLAAISQNAESSNKIVEMISSSVESDIENIATNVQ